MPLQQNFQLGPLSLRINWLIAACVAMTFLTLFRLGMWQLDRAAEKVAAQEALQAELRDNAPALESLPPTALRPGNPDLQNRHVSLVGEYLNERTILVLAEFFDSQIGFGVVTPFRLASNQQLVLVHRGWTTGILPPETPPYLNPVSGPVTVTGQLHVPDANERVLPSQIDANEWPLRVRGIELNVLSQILDEPLFPYVIRITADQPGTLVRHWPAVNVDVNQNLFYALQWFSFAALVLLGSLFACSNLWSLLRSD